MSADFPTFRPRLPWFGRHLQTMRNVFVPPRPDLARCRSERLVLPLDDGSGDRLAGLLQHPDGGGAKPLAVLIHGLGGTEDSAYMLASAATLLGAGHPVLRLNLRGAGASRPLCRLQYHAGRSGDLRAALSALAAPLRDPGFFVLGFSLGGNMLLKFLAEFGQAFPLLGAATVSAPIDLAAASRRILEPRNRVYQAYLLRGMKEESLAGPAAVTAEERRRIVLARSILEFDDRFVAPRNGYADAAEYYAENSAARFLAAIRVPTLVIHALDDPWIPPDAYRCGTWAENPHLVPLLPTHGGHVGFHGRDSRVPWHDRCAVQWFAHAKQDELAAQVRSGSTTSMSENCRKSVSVV